MLPATVHTAGEALANSTGLVDGPGVAETVKLPPGAYTGAAGLAAKLLIACVAGPMFTASVACGAAA